MKQLTFNRKGESYSPLTYWQTDDKTLIAIYQGNRGSNPELDFIVKYKEEGKRLRAPSHTHWIVDLLLKCEMSKEVVGEYIDTMLEWYDKTEPFKTKQERNIYKPFIYSTMDYHMLDGFGYFTMETLTTFIELFIKCEKQTPNAFMFRGLLELFKGYCEGTKDFYQIVGHSKRV